jgi:hypothetical protein
MTNFVENYLVKMTNFVRNYLVKSTKIGMVQKESKSGNTLSVPFYLIAELPRLIN